MYGKIEQDAVESPEVFQDLAYVENLNSQLRNKYSFLSSPQNPRTALLSRPCSSPRQ